MGKGAQGNGSLWPVQQIIEFAPPTVSGRLSPHTGLSISPPCIPEVLRKRSGNSNECPSMELNPVVCTFIREKEWGSVTCYGCHKSRSTRNYHSVMYIYYCIHCFLWHTFLCTDRRSSCSYQCLQCNFPPLGSLGWQMGGMKQLVLEGIMCVEKAWYVGGNGDYGYAIWLKVRGGITHDRIKTIGKGGRTRKMMKIVIR